MKEYVNKFTGEVKKRDFGTPIWHPLQDFEEYKPGTSMTVPDQVEPLKDTIARCMRGEMLLDSAREKPHFYNEGLSDAEIDILDGYADIADVPNVLSAAQAADGANSEVAKPQESAAQASDSTTTDSETKSTESSESKG